MLAKCANPDCSTRFLYLREGKLFRIEIASDAPPPKEEDENASGPYLVSKKPVRHVEHYWLCARCAETMTLSYEPGLGVTAIPRDIPVRRHAAAS